MVVVVVVAVLFVVFLLLFVLAILLLCSSSDSTGIGVGVVLGGVIVMRGAEPLSVFVLASEVVGVAMEEMEGRVGGGRRTVVGCGSAVIVEVLLLLLVVGMGEPPNFSMILSHIPNSPANSLYISRYAVDPMKNVSSAV